MNFAENSSPRLKIELSEEYQQKNKQGKKQTNKKIPKIKNEETNSKIVLLGSSFDEARGRCCVVVSPSAPRTVLKDDKLCFISLFSHST